MKKNFSLISPRRAVRCERLFLFLAIAALSLPATSARAQLDKTDTAPVTPPPSASAGFASAERIVKQLAPGVVWIQEITPPAAPGGPLVVNVVQISPEAAKSDKLHSSLGAPTIWENNPSQGRETVSKIASQSNGLVAINAGFFTFSSGHPIGLHIENGEAITEPFVAKKRTAFTIDKDGVGGVSLFAGTGVVTSEDGASFPINGFNRRAGKGNELLVYTPHWFGTTLRVPERYEVQLTGISSPFTFNQKIEGIAAATGTGGGTLLDPQTVVLSGSGAAAQFLREHVASGKKVSLRYDVSPALANVRQAIAGGPRLVDGGKVFVNYVVEGFDKAFSTSRHPRTAVGVTKDGSILLLTVDGRQSFLSRGATLEETGTLLVKFGAVSGVNMDGGGSTAMTVRGTVINSPSDGGERSVASAFVLSGDSGPQPALPEEPLFSAFAGPVPLGGTRSFALPPTVSKADGDQVVWSVRGPIGFISQGGNFIGLKAGSGSVLASLPDGRRFSRPIVVVSPTPPRPTPIPSPSPVPVTPGGVPGS